MVTVYVSLLFDAVEGPEDGDFIMLNAAIPIVRADCVPISSLTALYPIPWVSINRTVTT